MSPSGCDSTRPKPLSQRTAVFLAFLVFGLGAGCRKDSGSKTAAATIKERSPENYDTLRATFAVVAHVDEIRRLLDMTDEPQSVDELRKIRADILTVGGEALDEARRVEPGRLESIYGGWGDAFRTYLQPSLPLFVKGIQGDDPRQIMAASRLMEKWVAWSRENNKQLQETFQGKFGVKIPVRGPGDD